MPMILFVNGCVRENSRTLELARAVLAKETDAIEEIRLYPDGPDGLDAEKLALRDELLRKKEFDHPMLRFARQFAQADTIVIAAPYWDLAFPAKVRAYLEEVTVSGITFHYGENGIPQGLCKAKRLIYITTAGGPIFENFNFGYDYVKALAQGFYGISDVSLVKADGLDIWGADVEAIMEKAKNSV
ncbi:MAG: NAD(P)H-dependent oxidoreductase [Oscillospiraceae bacterium]|nr:NAD(P)H-dependent oxidoreductase [Oscillospiraceae bacterium]